MQKGFKWLISIVAAVLAIILLVAWWGSHLYIDWLWFQSLGYSNIFKTILLSEIGLRVLVGLIAFLFIFINLMLTRKSVLQSISARQINKTDDDIITIHQSPLNKYLTPRLLTLTYLAISAALGIFVSTAVTGDWGYSAKIFAQHRLWRYRSYFQ